MSFANLGKNSAIISLHDFSAHPFSSPVVYQWDKCWLFCYIPTGLRVSVQFLPIYLGSGHLFWSALYGVWLTVSPILKDFAVLLRLVKHDQQFGSWQGLVQSQSLLCCIGRHPWMHSLVLSPEVHTQLPGFMFPSSYLSAISPVLLASLSFPFSIF